MNPTMNPTITFDAAELEILLQALNARDSQLRYHIPPTDPRRVALPVLERLHAKAGDALAAIYASRRNAA